MYSLKRSAVKISSFLVLVICFAIEVPECRCTATKYPVGALNIPGGSKGEGQTGLGQEGKSTGGESRSWGDSLKSYVRNYFNPESGRRESGNEQDVPISGNAESDTLLEPSNITPSSVEEKEVKDSQTPEDAIYEQIKAVLEVKEKLQSEKQLAYVTNGMKQLKEAAENNDKEELHKIADDAYTHIQSMCNVLEKTQQESPSIECSTAAVYLLQIKMDADKKFASLADILTKDDRFQKLLDMLLNQSLIYNVVFEQCTEQFKDSRESCYNNIIEKLQQWLSSRSDEETTPLTDQFVPVSFAVYKYLAEEKIKRIPFPPPLPSHLLYETQEVSNKPEPTKKKWFRKPGWLRMPKWSDFRKAGRKVAQTAKRYFNAGKEILTRRSRRKKPPTTHQLDQSEPLT